MNIASKPSAHRTRIKARSLKVTCVLDPNEILAIGDVQIGRVVLSIVVPDVGTVSADIAAKALRKAQTTIAEHGAERVAVIIQGKCAAGGRIVEAGLVAQVKAPKPIEVEAVQRLGRFDR